jgi:hypothetical protein
VACQKIGATAHFNETTQAGRCSQKARGPLRNRAAWRGELCSSRVNPPVCSAVSSEQMDNACLEDVWKRRQVPLEMRLFVTEGPLYLEMEYSV